MSNVEYYELEAEVKSRLDGLGEALLRELLKRLVDDGSVNTVREIATILKIK